MKILVENQSVKEARFCVADCPKAQCTANCPVLQCGKNYN